MLSERHLYRFGEFELYADENVFRRNGETISLTPKMYEMLLVLVRNGSQVVEKDTLLKEVWPDSFVEEGNITFNIRQLRKALGDDAQTPLFIETVPRRGYRFISPVKEVLPATETIDDQDLDRVDVIVPPEANANSGSPSASRHIPIVAIAIGLLLIAGLIGFTIWYRTASAPLNSAPLLSENFSSEKLSTNGLVHAVAISPDGQQVIYSNKLNSKNSVWLRDLSSASSIEIIPASEGTYFDFAFSPDGATVYFSRGLEEQRASVDIYRMPIRGGIPEKLITNTEGWISLSADGRKISFVRCPHRDDEYCSLWTADAPNGGNERRLASRPRPIRIADNEISPDGTRIAFASGQSRNQAYEFRLMEVPIDGGEEREITSERFFNIRGLAWLPDAAGLLITASRIPNKYFRIWFLSASDGRTEPLTKDPETYAVLSLDKNADRLISTQVKQDFKAYYINLSDPEKKRPLADATAAVFSGPDKIVFSSTMSGNDEIWSMDREALSQRQLTNDQADDRRPIASQDGRVIFFSSNRTGEAHVWRMAADGSGQTKLTTNDGGSPVFATQDGRTLYYQHSITGDLWSVSLENGIEKPVLKRELSNYAISSDGSRVVFSVKGDGDENVLNIASLPDGRSTSKLKLPPKSSLVIAAWAQDGNSLVYIAFDAADNKNKLYRQNLDGSPPRKLTDVDGDTVTEFYSLSLASDEKTVLLVQGGWKHDAVLIKGLK